MAVNSLTETQGFWPLWRMVAATWRNLNRQAGTAGLVHSAQAHSPTANPVMNSPLQELTAPRFLVWVDGVGAYLVCTATSVVLGQPANPPIADIPIWADISRRHAVLHRDREGYLLEPLRETWLDGRPVHGLTYVRDGQVVQLGASVQLRFRKPHPLSMSARLEWVSHHRTQPATDGVVLFAEACTFGPQPTSHIQCPQASRELVLFRQGSDWQVRSAGEMQIDGQTVQGKGRIRAYSRIVLPDTSLSVEPLA